MPQRSLLALALACAAALVPLAASATAAPATYPILTCADPATAFGFEPAGTGDTDNGAPGWGGSYQTQTKCTGTLTSLDGMMVRLTGYSFGPGADWGLRFTAPADTLVAGIELYRRAKLGDAVDQTLRGVWLTPGTEAETTMVRENGSQEYCGYPCAVGSFAGSAGPFDPAQRLASSAPIAADRFELVIQCPPAGPGCPQRQLSDPALVQIYGGRITLSDAIAPIFTQQPSGSLFDGGALRGFKTIAFGARDKGGGLEKAVLELDGKPAWEMPLDENEGRCVRPFKSLVPCRLELTPSLPVDTTKLPEGEHEAKLLVYDATGVNRAESAVRRITVDNSPDRGRPNGVGAGDGARLTAGVGRKARRSVRLGFGRSLTVSGRLVDAAGNPIRAADVRVLERFDQQNAGFTDVGALVTDDAGRFRYLARGGPSRTLRFGYRAYTEDPDYAAIANVVVTVRAAVTLSVRRARIGGRRALRFRGRLRGGPIPRGGKLVEILARENGRWRPVTSARSDGRGRYKASYRFSRGARRTSFPFRTRVRRDASYPYAQGFSRVRRPR